jgi:hypothetical protein
MPAPPRRVDRTTVRLRDEWHFGTRSPQSTQGVIQARQRVLARDGRGVWTGSHPTGLAAPIWRETRMRTRRSIPSLLLVGCLVGGCAAAASPAPSLSDAARLWCLDNDHGQNGFGTVPDTYDLVTEAANKLGITFPKVVTDYDAAWRIMSASGGTATIPADVASAYVAFFAGDGIKTWRASPEYARACAAAFGSR